MPDYPIRIADTTRRLLLLPRSRRVATGPGTCPEPEPEEIMVGYLVVRPIPSPKGEKPHFWCIGYDVHVTSGAARLGDYTVRNGVAAFPLWVKPPCTISLGLFWTQNHSPYPDQSDMQVWCLGKYCGWFYMYMANYQGASSSPSRYVAAVKVTRDGKVTVTTSGSGSPFPIDPS